jgi:hypothetical protein
MHDVYVDDSFCRAVVGNDPGNEPGYGNEIQIPVSWNDTAVTIRLRLGAHPAFTGKTLAVFNENNQRRVIGTFI